MMERIRDYLEGLRIQDPRHELSRNPTMIPLGWERNKYQPILMTTSPELPPMLKPANAKLGKDALIREAAMSDAPSSGPSRTSSYSGSPSCFSNGENSASTVSSNAGTCQWYRERFIVPAIHDGRKSQQQSQFLKSSEETLHEEHIVCKESRDVLITKPNPRRALLDVQQIEDKKDLLVRDDLDQERREIRRGKQRKVQLRAAKQANALEKESQFHATSTQVSLDRALHDSMLESGEITITGLDDSQVPPTADPSCYILPSLPLVETTFGQRIEHGSKNPSQLSSQTDSTSLEDATDWEEESNAGSSPDPTQFLLTRDAEEELEWEPSLVRSHLTPMKSSMVERLIADFWAVFNDSSPTGTRQYGSASDGASQSTTTSTSESGALSQNSSGVRHVKRCRSDDGEDEETDDHPGRRRKRLDKLPAVGEDDSLVRQLACPYRKHDPRKYSLQGWPRCALKPLKTIARLKAHLYQYHLIQQCQRCKSVFESEEALDAHTMAEERCEVQRGEPVDGITRKMKDQIQCRRKPHPGQTDAEKWEQIYKILFPSEVVPDPYFEPVPDHDMYRPQSPDSVNLADYEAYLRRVLPGFVKNALEVAVSNEFQSIETQLQGRMMETIQEAQNRAFLSFRNMRRSESEARLTAGPDTNMASTVDSNQQTSIETFFQPPPPAIYPVSFSNLSELRISQQNTGHNESSDSGYASRPSLSNSSQHASLDRVEGDATFSSGNYDQTQTNPDVSMDSSTFNVTQLRNLGGTDSTAASSWLGMPQTPPDLLVANPSAPLLPVEADYNDSLPTQFRHMTEDLFYEESWCSDIEPIENEFPRM